MRSSDWSSDVCSSDLLAPAWCANWDGKQPLALPGSGQLQLDGAWTFDAPLRVHARHGGERIRLPGRDHSHALKHVLQDLGVPPWQRDRLPLLSDASGEVHAAAARAVSATPDASLRTDRKSTRMNYSH